MILEINAVYFRYNLGQRQTAKLLKGTHVLSFSVEGSSYVVHFLAPDESENLYEQEERAFVFVDLDAPYKRDPDCYYNYVGTGYTNNSYPETFTIHCFEEIKKQL